MESHERAYASFTVSGDQVSPEFWTGYFGVVPDIAHTKGDPVVDRNGQPRNIERRTGVWGVRSQSSVRSDHPTPHLQYLVGLPRADLPDLLNKQAARMRFFRYWDNETGDRVPDVPADIRAMMTLSAAQSRSTNIGSDMRSSLISLLLAARPTY